ncbi:hypothetical protein EJ07DRAFT_152620 [Lizonia empirigonia]|nr:hypothetical protein EJ07DRAFT_152620 [Lizonia empirigonia]
MATYGLLDGRSPSEFFDSSDDTVEDSDWYKDQLSAAPDTSHGNTPTSHDNTHTSHDNTPTSHDNTHTRSSRELIEDILSCAKTSRLPEEVLSAKVEVTKAWHWIRCVPDKAQTIHPRDISVKITAKH